MTTSVNNMERFVEMCADFDIDRDDATTLWAVADEFDSWEECIEAYEDYCG